MSEEVLWSDVQWDIRRKGRAWKGPEAHKRYHLSPEKIEMIEGQLFWTDEDRLMMLGLLLENVGVDQAVRFGKLETWKEAITELERSTSS